MGTPGTILREWFMRVRRMVIQLLIWFMIWIYWKDRLQYFWGIQLANSRCLNCYLFKLILTTMHTLMPQCIMKIRREIFKKNKELNRPVNRYWSWLKKMLWRKYKRKKINILPKIYHKEKPSGLRNLIGLLVLKDIWLFQEEIHSKMS